MAMVLLNLIIKIKRNFINNLELDNVTFLEIIFLIIWLKNTIVKNYLIIANDPTYSSTLITSKIEEIKVKSKVKLDEETFRFTYYVKIKFDLEQLKNHGEGSDGGTIKATATEEFNDVYVDVKNNKIFKTNIDESMKNATVLWDGKSYLNLDWQSCKIKFKFKKKINQMIFFF